MRNRKFGAKFWGRLAEGLGHAVDTSSIACLLVTQEHHGFGIAVVMVAVLRTALAGSRPGPADPAGRYLERMCTLLDGVVIALVLAPPPGIAASVGVETAGLLIRLWIGSAGRVGGSPCRRLSID
jgi:cytochrome b561